MSPPSPSRVLDRFEQQAPLHSDGEISVSRGRDLVDGSAVELVRLEPHAALRAGARGHFAAAWQPWSPTHGGWLPPLAGPPPQGDPVGVRSPTAAPWSSELRLRPEQVRQAAGWIGAALLAGGRGLGGALDHRDLVIDLEGVPRISPSGLTRVESVAALPRHRPPTQSEGPAGERDAALYGLGVVLFRALTGAWPADGASPGSLKAAQARPRRARELQPDIPADVDALLAALLDPNPALRAPAVAAMARTEPPTIPVEQAPLPASSVAPPKPSRAGPALRVTQSAPASSAARVDRAVAPWLVVLDRAGATEASLRRLEALLPELPHFALRDSARDADRLVIATAPTREAAEARATALASSGAPLLAVSSSAPAPARVGQLAGWVIAAVLAPVLGFLALGPVAAGVGAVVGLALALFAGSQVRRSEAQARALSAPASDPAQMPALPARQRSVLDAVRSARKAILDAELAAPLRVDLLGSLDEIESACLAVSDARATELAALREAAEEIGQAVGAAAGPSSSPDSRAAVDAARRRAAAARAALRQS